MASLSLRNVTKKYPNGFVAVKDFNLEIADKEFIIFVGPSGCGKSTTLRMIAGLEDISSGELYIDGKLVNDVEPKDRDIAMVFQNYALYPHMSVYDNMAFGLKLRKTPKDEIDKKVHDAAKILDLEHLLDRKPKALSGGQRQRVAMGRAIVRSPKVFLMDEPLSNLDAKLRVGLRSELKKLQKNLGITTLYVTHDQEEALTLSDRIAVFNNGFVEQVDKPYNIYNHSGSEFVCDFIGEINRLNAAVLSEVETQTGHALDGNKSGYVRLERISLKEIPGYAKMHGVIRDYDYNGVMTKYRVEVMGCEIRVIHVNDGQPFMEIGQELDIYMNPRDIMQF